MRKVLNAKSLCAIMLCLIMAISICGCKKTEQASSDIVSNPTVANPSTGNDSFVDNSSIDETPSEAPVQTPSQDDTSSNESTNTTTQTPAVDTESSDVESTTTSSTPVVSDSPSSETVDTKPKTNAELIVGKWRGSYDMAPMLSEMGFGTIEGTAIVSCDIEFTSNGVFYENIDRASAELAYHTVFTQMLNNTLTQEGYTKEQFEAASGMTLDEYVGLLVDSAMESIPKTIINAYKFVENDLYVRTQDDTDFVKNEYRFVDENTLIITEEGESITYTRIG